MRLWPPSTDGTSTWSMVSAGRPATSETVELTVGSIWRNRSSNCRFAAGSSDRSMARLRVKRSTRIRSSSPIAIAAVWSADAPRLLSILTSLTSSKACGYSNLNGNPSWSNVLSDSSPQAASASAIAASASGRRDLTSGAAGPAASGTRRRR